VGQSVFFSDDPKAEWEVVRIKTEEDVVLVFVKMKGVIDE
jgi:hypothetical protein